MNGAWDTPSQYGTFVKTCSSSWSSARHLLVRGVVHIPRDKINSIQVRVLGENWPCRIMEVKSLSKVLR
jgi:hypothetical protein